MLKREYRIKLPGYWFATTRWLQARPGSNSETVWGWMRDHLRLRIGHQHHHHFVISEAGMSGCMAADCPDRRGGR